MFTGLIETVGRVVRLDRQGRQCRITLQPGRAFSDLELGESIAVQGVCLTVERIEKPLFSVYASAETLQTSSLGRLGTGGRVNLERALAVGDRLGGHIVSGHVDSVGRIQEVRPAGESKVFRIAFPQAWSRLVVPKGSVALDGVSLTVNDCGQDFLEVNIIPATLRETTIPEWQPGAEVNMEFDVIGKYVQRMMAPWQPEVPQEGQGSDMDWDFLRRHGFA